MLFLFRIPFIYDDVDWQFLQKMRIIAWQPRTGVSHMDEGQLDPVLQISPS